MNSRRPKWVGTGSAFANYIFSAFENYATDLKKTVAIWKVMVYNYYHFPTTGECDYATYIPEWRSGSAVDC